MKAIAILLGAGDEAYGHSISHIHMYTDVYKYTYMYSHAYIHVHINLHRFNLCNTPYIYIHAHTCLQKFRSRTSALSLASFSCSLLLSGMLPILPALAGQKIPILMGFLHQTTTTTLTITSPSTKPSVHDCYETLQRQSNQPSWLCSTLYLSCSA